MTCLYTRRLFRSLWLAAIFIVVIGSLLPAHSTPMLWLGRLHISDKFEHCVAYFVLTFLPMLHERRGLAVASAAGALALGVGLEYAQLYSGWRDFEIMDMVADTVGVFLGAAVAVPLRPAQFAYSALGRP